MIDRPHGQYVLELAEPTLQIAEVLVDRHHVEHAQPRLAGRDHIFTFDALLTRQARFVLEVAKASLVDVPRVVAVAVIPLQQALGRGTDLLGLLQLAGRDPFPELLQRLTGPLHRPLTHGLLVTATLIGVDDDDPHALDPRRDFLGAGAGRIGLLSRRDPDRAI